MGSQAYSDAVASAYKLGGFHFERLFRRRPSTAVTVESFALVVFSVVLTLTGIAADAIPERAIDLTGVFYPLLGFSVLFVVCGMLLYWFGTLWKRAMFDLMSWEKRLLELDETFERAAQAETPMENHPSPWPSN